MICVFQQNVRIVDMNDEIIHETVFEHGQFDSVIPTVGSSVVSHELGLRQFEVVLDKRPGKTARYKIVDVEYDILGEKVRVTAQLEAITLIVGQHDVGLINS
ncbi:hypothetical protein [Paenibacillus turpanensis]|uniref:hypothetical protein n=1 Tax=Paenibacillus turpanensis TaxID=2689078 RepID=UPI001407665F|nr:hypothetical protein [Paenibacillus turpanensis]